jgi:hypothetical protein
MRRLALLAFWTAAACSRSPSPVVASVPLAKQPNVRPQPIASDANAKDDDCPLPGDGGTFAAEVAPLLRDHCVTCHSARDDQPAAGGLVFDPALAEDAASALLPTWRRALAVVQTGEMPLAPEPAPPACAIKRFANYVAHQEASCTPIADHDAVSLRRLSRAELKRTLDTFLDAPSDVVEDQLLPPDPYGYGFDNNARLLAVSPLHLEQYATIAERLAAWILPSLRSFTRAWTPTDLPQTGPAHADGGHFMLYEPVNVGVTLDAGVEGDYILRARVFGEQAGNDTVLMSFTLDGVENGRFRVPESAASPGIRTQRVHVKRGSHTVGIGFLNDYWNPDSPDPRDRDRNLGVDALTIEGPLAVDPARVSPLYREVMVCEPTATTHDDCARDILRRLARRVFRAELDEAALAPYSSLVALAESQGDDFARGLRLALEAMLVSPRFLYRFEDGGRDDALVSAPELATRLSYFLWSAPPDDVLLAAARDGSLLQDGVLAAQVQRMLADPKAEALASVFATQWWDLRALSVVAPDPQAFPTFSETLRASMRRESELFFQGLVQDDASLRRLLDADFTYVDRTLAAHYGLPAPSSDGLVRVALAADSPRRGLLGKAAILTVTSAPARTSPVKRGKWLLDRLLCASPPPPPPNIPSLPEPGGATGTTVRERLEAHRRDPRCNSCHKTIDPLGFALENFDGIGAWRTTDGEAPVDASGSLPDGRAFAGAPQLAALLAEDARFTHCVTQKALTYALGRGLTRPDQCAADAIAADLAQGDATVRDLFTRIALSAPFRTQATPKGIAP